MTSSANVYSSIEGCTICPDHNPFHFELGNQKVMLITPAPIQATVIRPLYFIQYFRQICLALFGDLKPTEQFIREFYDPSGVLYWTHYQKCYKNDDTISDLCEPLLRQEVQKLDPEVIIIIEQERIPTLKDRGFIRYRKNNEKRKLFHLSKPNNRNDIEYREVRQALKPYIPWIKINVNQPDYSGAHFLELEFASIQLFLGFSPQDLKLTNNEKKWVEGIILPNIQAYNIALQVFIFIESNIKTLLYSRTGGREDISKKWFGPFEQILLKNYKENPIKQKQAKNLMRDIDGLHILRNIIVHGNGVIDEGYNNEVLLEKLRRLPGVYLYGGNSTFISEEGVRHLTFLSQSFKEHFEQLQVESIR